MIIQTPIRLRIPRNEHKCNFFLFLNMKQERGISIPNEGNARKHSVESQILATLKQTPGVFIPEGRE